MAVTRKTQKDIGQYEPKFIGPFTLRQSISLGLGAALCFVVCTSSISSNGIDATSLFTICFTIMIPFFIFGWVKPYGLRIEDFIKECYVYHYLSPHIRPYETETTLETMEWDDPSKIDEPNGKKQKTKKYVHKKDKEYPDYL